MTETTAIWILAEEYTSIRISVKPIASKAIIGAKGGTVSGLRAAVEPYLFPGVTLIMTGTGITTMRIVAMRDTGVNRRH